MCLVDWSQLVWSQHELFKNKKKRGLKMTLTDKQKQNTKLKQLWWQNHCHWYYSAKTKLSSAISPTWFSWELLKGLFPEKFNGIWFLIHVSLNFFFLFFVPWVKTHKLVLVWSQVAKVQAFFTVQIIMIKKNTLVKIFESLSIYI